MQTKGCVEIHKPTIFFSFFLRFKNFKVKNYYVLLEVPDNDAILGVI